MFNNKFSEDYEKEKVHRLVSGGRGYCGDIRHTAGRNPDKRDWTVKSSYYCPVCVPLVYLHKGKCFDNHHEKIFKAKLTLPFIDQNMNPVSL